MSNQEVHTVRVSFSLVEVLLFIVVLELAAMLIWGMDLG